MKWRLAHEGQIRIAAIAMALVVVFAQFTPAPLAARAVTQNAPLTEDEQKSQPSEGERDEAQLLSPHSAWRGSVSRDLRPAGRLPADTPGGRRFTAHDLLRVPAPAEHDFRNGTGTPLVC